MDVKNVFFDTSKLKDFRRAKGLTGTDVARLTGTTRALISIYENGKAKPSADMVARLCIIYGISMDDLTVIRPEISQAA